MPDGSGRCPDIDASDQNKNQRDHQCGRDGAKVEYVNVGQDRSLRADNLADQRHRLSGGVGCGEASQEAREGCRSALAIFWTNSFNSSPTMSLTAHKSRPSCDQCRTL
jgi:hypothetical protein